MAFRPQRVKMVIRGEEVSISSQGRSSRGTPFTIGTVVVSRSDLKDGSAEKVIEKLLRKGLAAS